MRILRYAALAAATLAALASPVSARAATAGVSAAGVAAAGVAADGATVVAEHQVDARTLDITVSSPAAGTAAQVRLLLPPGWSPSATQTWPVLYLLHGCCDTYQGWTQNTNVGQFTQGAPVIIALPDGGPAGLYTNWWDFGFGSRAWETFTATELPQILRSGFRASARQVIGGVSTGGGAALILAAHHPGEYAAVASYSGADCTLLPSAVALVQATVIIAAQPPDALWGNPIFQRTLWQQHDPCSLASSLRGTPMFLSVGSGVTSSGSNTACSGGGNILESAIAPLDYAFTAKLNSLGIAYTSDFYSGGCHSWAYWQTEFARSWPMLAASLAG